MLKNKRALVFALIVFTLLIGGLSLYKTREVSGTTDEEEFNQTVRDALAELNFSNGNSPAAINAATNNLANFIYYRSGVQLSQTNKGSLSRNEYKSRTESKRVTQAQLADIFTTVAFEKLVTLSDSDIDQMAETLRGFNSPDLLTNFPGFRKHVKLRANGEGTIDPTVFIAQLKDARASEINYQSQMAANPKTARAVFARTALCGRLNTEITARSNYLAAASPDFFNGAANNDLTPEQSMLLTYSIITDDPLAGNRTELQSKMNEMQQVVTKYTKHPYPSSLNHRAYGVNGYIYSTPTNLLFDDAFVTRVLNLIKEKANL